MEDRPKVVLWFMGGSEKTRGPLASESREAFMGALRYFGEQTDWPVVTFGGPLTPTRTLLNLSDLNRNRVAGVIFSYRQSHVAERCIEQGIPVVGMNCFEVQKDIPCVLHDDEAIGRMAAVHFLRRGIRSLAFYGPDYEFARSEPLIRQASSEGLVWLERRLHGFSEAAREAKATLSVFCDLGQKTDAEETEAALMQRFWHDLSDWMEALPRPAGILVGSDAWAQNCLAACANAGLRVPGDIAVLGVDNDMFRCESCRPSLSSIDRNLYRIGYQSAALLAQFLQTGKWDSSPILVPPAGVVERHSTQAIAVANPKLAQALQFVRDHFTQPISPREVARAIGMSESWLRHGFQHDLHFSLVSEIRRLRVQKACELLTTTDLPLKILAEAVGFGSETYFGHVFSEEIGVSPGAWRTASGRGRDGTHEATV